MLSFVQIAVVCALLFIGVVLWMRVVPGSKQPDSMRYTVSKIGSDIYEASGSPYFEPGDAASNMVAFDVRQKWPDRINAPRTLTKCSATWASAAVQCLSDRRCISGISTSPEELSTEYVLQCSCDEQEVERSGCHRGSLKAALIFLQRFGTPSEGCQPYIDSNHRSSTNICPSGCVNRTDKPSYVGYASVMTRSYITESDMTNSFKQTVPEDPNATVDVVTGAPHHGKAKVLEANSIVLLHIQLPNGAQGYRVLQKEDFQLRPPYTSESAWLDLLYRGVWSDSYASVRNLLASDNIVIARKRSDFNEHLRRAFVMGVKNEVMTNGPFPVTMRVHPSAAADLEAGNVYAVAPGASLPNPCYTLSAAVVGWKRTDDGDVWVLRTDLGPNYGDHGYVYVRIGTIGGFETQPVTIGYVNAAQQKHSGVWGRLVSESEWTPANQYPSLQLGNAQRVELGLCARRKETELGITHDQNTRDSKWTQDIYYGGGKRGAWAAPSKYQQKFIPIVFAGVVCCILIVVFGGGGSDRTTTPMSRTPPTHLQGQQPPPRQAQFAPQTPQRPAHGRPNGAAAAPGANGGPAPPFQPVRSPPPRL